MTAEYGVAAHWKYKTGSGEGTKPGDEEKFAWIRRLLETQQESDAQDFFHNLKVDMFADEVFVFSPKGDVINLPAGATPIDFAYSIHSAIGNSMVGATVNGRIVNFDYVLQNGDIVDIRTSKNAPGPSRDWLNLAKSGAARTKIKQWFKKERREENIVHGKEQFERELRANGIPVGHRAAVQVTPRDYDAYDWLLTMDENNARNLRRILPHDPDGKIRPLLSFAGLQRGIADPWYTDDFGTTYDDLVLGCTAFLDALRRRGNI